MYTVLLYMHSSFYFCTVTAREGRGDQNFFSRTVVFIIIPVFTYKRICHAWGAVMHKEIAFNLILYLSFYMLSKFCLPGMRWGHKKNALLFFFLSTCVYLFFHAVNIFVQFNLLLVQNWIVSLIVSVCSFFTLQLVFYFVFVFHHLGPGKGREERKGGKKKETPVQHSSCRTQHTRTLDQRLWTVLIGFTA